MEDKHSLVILGLKPVLSESNTNKVCHHLARGWKRFRVIHCFQVKEMLCRLAVALADHNYLQTEGGNLVAEFLVRNLIATDEQQVYRLRGCSVT